MTENSHEKNPGSVSRLALQFLAEAIGHCPAALEQSKNQDVVFAVAGFQYGAVQSAATIAGLDQATADSIAAEVIGKISGMEQETVLKFLQVMPMLSRKKYPPIAIGEQAIIHFYNATSDEGKVSAASLLNDILRQIDAQ